MPAKVLGNCQDQIDLAQKELSKIGLRDWLSDITPHSMEVQRNKKKFVWHFSTTVEKCVWLINSENY